MKKFWILSLPALAYVLTGLVPFVWAIGRRFLENVRHTSSGSLRSLRGVEVLFFFERHVLPGTDWVSMPVLGPLAFAVVGIIATLWFVVVIALERDDKADSKH